MAAMRFRAEAQHFIGIPVMLLKLAGSVLLLLALGAMVLNVHHGGSGASADPGVLTVDASDGGPALDTASIDSDYSSLDLATTVCVFIVVWGLILGAARFSGRGSRPRMIVAVSPRGSPLYARPRRQPAGHLSLSQMSISRT